MAFTTYQAGKLFLIGLQPDGRLSVHERNFERNMGLAASQDSLWMTTLYQIWCFSNFLDPGGVHDGHDALWVLVASHITGDIDVDHPPVGADGAPIFAASRVNSVATLGTLHSFQELWRPLFIDRPADEDRCHLNGLAVRDGRPAYVTAISTSNIADGWRDHCRDGGILIDVATGNTIGNDVLMPHSPRLHDGRLYLL